MSSQYRVKNTTVVTTDSSNNVEIHVTNATVNNYSTYDPSSPITSTVSYSANNYQFIFTDTANVANVSVYGGSFTFSEPPPPAYSFQGTVSGYVTGTPSYSNLIEKYPFSSDSNSSDVGDLTQGRYNAAGQSSENNGYVSGGFFFPPSTTYNTIDKFPFAVDANATDVGDLTQTRSGSSGQSSQNNGYTSGGNTPSTNTIDKFPFASDANATDVGDLTQVSYQAAGQSSDVSGYTSGGFPPTTNTIDKFPFAADANATDVGDLTVSRGICSGQSSTTHGYTSGGYVPGAPATNIIDKFPFASDANATDVGDITFSFGRRNQGGSSSTTSGYTTAGNGGAPKAETNTNIIDKFPFASDGNATDVGDLSFTASRATTGHQY